MSGYNLVRGRIPLELTRYNNAHGTYYYDHASVWCPNGQRVLGGGCMLIWNVAERMMNALTVSMPNSHTNGSTGWACGWNFPTRANATASLYAICANVE